MCNYDNNYYLIRLLIIYKLMTSSARISPFPVFQLRNSSRGAIFLMSPLYVTLSIIIIYNFCLCHSFDK